MAIKWVALRQIKLMWLSCRKILDLMTPRSEQFYTQLLLDRFYNLIFITIMLAQTFWQAYIGLANFFFGQSNIKF